MTDTLPIQLQDAVTVECSSAVVAVQSVSHCERAQPEGVGQIMSEYLAQPEHAPPAPLEEDEWENVFEEDVLDELEHCLSVDLGEDPELMRDSDHSGETGSQDLVRNTTLSQPDTHTSSALSDAEVFSAESLLELTAVYSSLLTSVDEIFTRHHRKGSLRVRVSTFLRLHALRTFYWFLCENPSFTHTQAAQWAAGIHKPGLTKLTSSWSFTMTVLRDTRNFEKSGIFDLQDEEGQSMQGQHAKTQPYLSLNGGELGDVFEEYLKITPKDEEVQ